jgi:hypothetical protein
MDNQKEVMYYIYHIMGKKIGCTKNTKVRIKYTQKVNAFELLETHSCIYKASEREIELQKQYGYPVDKVPYWKTVEFGKKAYSKIKRPKKELFVKETIEERTERIKKLHTSQKERGVGFWDKNNSIKAGMVSKEKFSKPIVAYTYPTMNIVGEYTSAKVCGVELNIKNIGNIRNVLKGRGKSLNGYTFRYI